MLIIPKKQEKSLQYMVNCGNPMKLKDAMPMNTSKASKATTAKSRTISAPLALWERAEAQKEREAFPTMSDYIQHLLRTDTKGNHSGSHAV